MVFSSYLYNTYKRIDIFIFVGFYVPNKVDFEVNKSIMYIHWKILSMVIEY